MNQSLISVGVSLSDSFIWKKAQSERSGLVNYRLNFSRKFFQKNRFNLWHHSWYAITAKERKKYRSQKVQWILQIFFSYYLLPFFLSYSEALPFVAGSESLLLPLLLVFFSHSSISCVYVIEFSIATGCPPVNCAGIERNVHLAWFPQGQCFKLSNLFKAESVSLSQTFLSSFFSLKLSSQECIISFLVSYHDSWAVRSHTRCQNWNTI